MESGAQAAEIAESKKRSKAFGHLAAKGKTFLDAWAHAAGQPILLALSTFILSFSQCFKVPSPFAAAWIVALGASGYPLYWPALGCAAALGMRFFWGIAPDVWQYAGCALLILLHKLWKERGDLYLSLAAVLSLLPRFFADSFTQPPANLLLGGAGLLLGAVAAPAFRQGLKVLLSSRHLLSVDDKLCCLMLLIVLLTGNGYLAVFSVNLGQLLAVALTLCLGYAAGSAAAVCAGLLAGAALAFSGQNPLIMVQLSLGGLMAGLAYGRGRRWEACALFLLADLLATFLNSTAAPALSILAAAVGCLLFLRLGDELLFRVKTLLMAAQPVRSGMENAFAAEQMRRWESAMDRMAQALPLPGLREEDPMEEDLAQALCQTCSQKQDCWKERFAATKAMLKTVAGQAEAGEEAIENAVASLRGCGCIRLHMLRESAIRLQGECRARRAQEARARYEREMIRTHLTAMAQSVRRMAEAASGETVGDAKAAYDVSRIMREISFPGKLLYARHVDGHLQVAIEGEGLTLNRWQPEKLIRALKDKAQLSFKEIALERGRLLMEEAPPFALRIGSATLCAAQPEGGENPVSGDAVLYEELPGSRFLLALSDGMGHGEQARLESQKTLELLSLCMAAGYQKEQAITAVNGMMLSATGGDRFATVDLCVVDLWTGEAQMEKLGACTSFVRREDHVKPIAGAALPLGILEQAVPLHQRLKMYDRDTLVLVSDGVQDAYPDPAALTRAVDRCFYLDPQRMADALLRSALLAAGGVPKDDMTVLVMSVTNNKKEERVGDVQNLVDAV